MIIFGHRFIPSKSFYHVLDIDSIKHTPPSSTIYIEFSEENLDIIQHAQSNSISMAIKVSNITELIYSSSLDAKYIAVTKKDAKEFQNIAENYLFDAKILVMIDNEKDIEEIAMLGIDGIICSNAILKISS